MSRDSEQELDAVAQKLFDAARGEPLPNGAIERALAAATQARLEQQKARLVTRRWIWVGGGVAAAAIGLLLARPRGTENATPIAAERASAPGPTKPAPLPASAPTPSPSAAPAPSQTPEPSRLNAPVAVPTHSARPSSLADELAALKSAENALGKGDPQAALNALERYERDNRTGQLRAEAALLKMDALRRAGKSAEAAALAERFVADNPGSPLVDRARSFTAPK
jgi:hypothetical protein